MLRHNSVLSPRRPGSGTAFDNRRDCAPDPGRRGGMHCKALKGSPRRSATGVGGDWSRSSLRDRGAHLELLLMDGRMNRHFKARAVIQLDCNRLAGFDGLIGLDASGPLNLI